MADGKAGIRSSLERAPADRASRERERIFFMPNSGEQRDVCSLKSLCPGSRGQYRFVPRTLIICIRNIYVIENLRMMGSSSWPWATFPKRGIGSGKDKLVSGHWLLITWVVWPSPSLGPRCGTLRALPARNPTMIASGACLPGYPIVQSR